MLDKNAKIYVAGHRGLVGSAIWKNLEEKGYTNLIGKTHTELDLLDGVAVRRFFDEEQPEYVFLAAAFVGGIMANSIYRADFIYKNLQIQQEVLMDDIPDTLEADDGDMNEIPRSVLMKMIAELPDGYRTVFNLYVFEEKSHKEIAALLGITEHTSSSQFYRAKTLLIKKINEYRKKL